MEYYILYGTLSLAPYFIGAVKIAAAAYIGYKVYEKTRNLIQNQLLKKKIKEKTIAPNKVDAKGRTALMLTNTGTQTELLINVGANVNARDNDGKTPLMYAAERGDYKSLQLLLEAGAEINAVDNYGNSALIYAANSGNKKTLETLGNAGIDPNIANKRGRTALMYIADRDYFSTTTKPERVAYLIGIGADASMKDNEGLTAKDIYINHETNKDQGQIDTHLVKMLSVETNEDKKEKVKKTMSLQSKKANTQMESIEKKKEEKPRVKSQRRQKVFSKRSR